METAATTLGVVAAVVGIFSAMLRSKHPYEALWIGGVSACFIVLTACAGIHAKWKQQEAVLPPAGNGDKPSGRAFVVVSGPTLRRIEPDKSLLWYIPIRNSGDAIARRVAAQATSLVVPFDTPLEVAAGMFEKAPVAKNPDMTIPPDDTALLNTDTTHVLTADGVASVKAGTSRLYLFVRVHYDDGTGVRRSSQYCYVYAPEEETMFHIAEYCQVD